MNQDVEAIIMKDYTRQTALEAIKDPGLESIAFLFGRVFGKRLVATDVLVPSTDDYVSRNFAYLAVKPEFVASEFPKFIGDGKTLVATIHSHPGNLVEPSYPDIKETHKNVLRYYPHYLTGIYSNGIVNFYKVQENSVRKVEHRIVNSKNLKRFDRQMRFLGEEAQLLLSSTNALLIGAGGGNTLIAFALACMGIGKLTLIDFDRWEETDRNRVFIPSGHIGMEKVFSIKRLVNAYFPEVEVEAFAAKAESIPDEVYSKTDIMVVGPDTVTTRVFGNRKAIKHNKPAVFPAAGIFVEMGRIKTFGGSVQVFIPDKDYPCYECIANIDHMEVLRETLDAEKRRVMSENYMLGDLLNIPIAPSIIALNYQIAGMSIWEIVKIITGIEEPIPFQVYNNGELKLVKVSRDENCPACRKPELNEEKFLELEEGEELLQYIQRDLKKEGKDNG